MSEAFERIRVGLDEVRAIMDGRAVPARIEYASARVMTTPMLKRAWDELTETPDQMCFGLDCDEIHAELNARGEGAYCAV
jgi:hypothetical protein